MIRPSELSVGFEPPVDFQGEPWALVLGTLAETETISSGRSAPDGTWRAVGLKPGRYYLIVSDSTGSRVASDEILVGGPMTDHWVILESIEVEGWLTLGKEPIEGEVFFGGSSGMTSIRMGADAEGRFYGTLPRPGAWKVDIRSDSAGVHRRLRSVEVEPAAGSSRARVEIELPGTRLEGDVVDPEGRKVARATVLAVPVPKKQGEPAESPSHTRTQDDGLFHFEGFEPAVYRLQAIRVVSGKKELSEPLEVLLSEDDPFRSVRLVLGRPVLFRGRALSSSGGVPGASVLTTPSGGAATVLIPNVRTDPDGRFELNLPEGSSEVELTILAPGFLFYRRVVAISERGEVPIVLEQQGGGTIEIRPREPVELRGGVGLPYVVRADGMRIDLGTLQLWSSLNHVRSAAGLIEVPMMPTDAYQVCWPLTPDDKAEGRDLDCTEGYLPANGRLTIVQDSTDGSDEPRAE
ncbi:MAG: carboxypeptidase regulatory-like domain-containing protein [bacterium]|nr:carboxypeptidase regulatory-like domain-containing protein [bacterium]